MNTADVSVADHVRLWWKEHNDALVEFRRYLHAHPELSGAEHGTATLIAERLIAAGLRPRMFADGTGVLCDIGIGDRVIALRGDIDALPLPDVKDVPYRSTVEGVCHACGHDVHATVLLGTGLVLAEMADSLPTRVRLIFQPGEEEAKGALQAIEAGAMRDVSEIYAVHCNPQILSGQVGLRVGPFTAACDMVKVRLSGPGGHTARPHLTADLVGALGKIASDVPGLLARRVDSRSGVVTVFGAINAGMAPNVIPQHGTVSGSIRMMDTEVWDEMPALFEQVVRDAVAPYGVKVEIDYERHTAPVINDEHAISVFTTAAMNFIGPDAVVGTPHSMGGEDFSWYLQHVPGAMARLGVGRPGESLDLHQGNFDVDESAIGYGISLLTGATLEAMRR